MTIKLYGYTKTDFSVVTNARNADKFRLTVTCISHTQLEIMEFISYYERRKADSESYWLINGQFHFFGPVHLITEMVVFTARWNQISSVAVNVIRTALNSALTCNIVACNGALQWFRVIRPLGRSCWTIRHADWPTEDRACDPRYIVYCYHLIYWLNTSWSRWIGYT